MAYIPTEWKDGDVITAEKLNNIEEGIANNEITIIPIVNGACNLSYSDAGKLYSDFNNGKTIFFRVNFGNENKLISMNRITFESAEYDFPNRYYINGFGVYTVDSLNTTFINLSVKIPETGPSTVEADVYKTEVTKL